MRDVLNKIAIIAIIAVNIVACGLLATPPAFAQGSKVAVCSGIGVAVNSNGCDQSNGTSAINKTIAVAINVFSFIIGVISVIMIMVGGFKYVSSNGDSNNVTSAKNTILYAIVGIVVALMAQVIVQFVLSKTTK